MNITSLFESRNKTFSNLFKASIYLSRLLRENVCVLDIDKKNDVVYYLSESKNIVKANFFITAEKILLKDIEVLDTDEYLSEEKYNNNISSCIDSMLDASRASSYSEMNESFSSILNLISSRMRLDEARKKIETRLETISLNTINKSLYKKLMEAKSLIVKEIPKVLRDKDVKQSLLEDVKLSKAISSAFSYKDSVDIKSLHNTTKAFLKEDLDTPVFELICIQELIKKEILEAKDNLYSAWLYEDKVGVLIESATKSSTEYITALGDVLTDYPYFALLGKKNIESLIESYYDVTKVDATKKHISDISKIIFNSKKEFKKQLINLLQEKYGISLLQLKDAPSLKNLGKLQYRVLSTLAEKLEPGVAKDVLTEAAKEIRFKYGIDLLDINSYINQIFTESNALPKLEENMIRYLNLPALKAEIESIKQALTMAAGGMGGGMSPQMAGGNPMGDPASMEQGIDGMGAEAGAERPEDLDQVAGGMDNMAGGEEGMGGALDQMGGGQQAPGEEMPIDGAGMEGGAPPVPEGEIDRNQIMATLKQLEQMIAGLGMDTDVYPEGELDGAEDMERIGGEAGEIETEGDPAAGGPPGMGGGKPQMGGGPPAGGDEGGEKGPNFSKRKKSGNGEEDEEEEDEDQMYDK